MPAKNVTIDDVSALIQYQPPGQPQSQSQNDAWGDSPTGDPTLGSYYDGTYHSSRIYRASATFQFDGTAVYLYAAKRGQHGPYSIYLDDRPAYNASFYSNTPLFKQLMYSATNLTPGPHNLTCVNTDPTNKTYIEVDYIEWTTSMDPSLTESSGTAISVSNMTYSSMNAWMTGVDSEPTMVTQVDGASVMMNFSGNGIELWGKTGSMFGQFSAQIDDLPAQQLNAYSQQTHTTILFRQDNLSSGNHSLVVTNRGGGFGSLAVGQATPIIWSTDPNPSPTSSPSSSSKNTSPAGAIAGAIAGAVIVLAALLFALLWFRRRRRRAREQAQQDSPRPDHDPVFMNTTPFVLPPPLPISHRDSKFTAEESGASMYRAVPGSPGLNSQSSFEYMPTPGSSSAGWSPRPGGKEARRPGPMARQEFDEESLRDRDAGPVPLPVLPPAYSSSSASSAPPVKPEREAGGRPIKQ